ncbi:MAG TPA: LptF/LptG family permease [Thermoanaerobaculia bacterium]|nr:LptF/LptG family permease [Thermoanaerobaculia bacterium]
MRRLDRYLLSEAVGPLALGLGVYTFILLLQFLFASAELIIRRGLGPEVVGRMLLLSLPNILVLTIPMSLLFGLLLAVGRLSADSELIALRACGVSLFAIARPLLLLGLLLTIGNTWLATRIMPAANYALQQLQIQLVTQTVAQQVEPRVIFDQFPGKTLYVFDIDRESRLWRGVVLADAVPGPRNEIIVADRGTLRLAADGEQLTLHLEEAIRHSVDFTRPDRYEVSRYRTLDLLLRDRFTSDERERLANRKGVRSMTPSELRRYGAEPNATDEQRRLARVEIHKKYAFPAASLVFALLAVPLGFSNRRGGKSSGFAVSIGVILVYYVIVNQGEEAARVGRLPAGLAIWLPNLLLAALGLYLLFRRDRDLPLLPLRFSFAALPSVTRLVRRWRRASGERKPPTLPRPADSPAAPASPGPSPLRSAETRFVLRFNRPRLAFPNILDRYVLGLLGRIFVVVLLSCVALAVIADFSQQVDEIFRNQPARQTVIDYYEFFALQAAYDFAPIAVLVTTLIALSLLGRSNELTAAKALGISLFRIGLPVAAGAAGVALLFAWLQADVLVASNQRMSDLREEIVGRRTGISGRRPDQRWLAGEGRVLYNYLSYDETEQRLRRLQVLQFDERFDLTARLVAEEAAFTPAGWVISQAWVRSGEGFSELSWIPGPTRLDLPEEPGYFAAEHRRADEMSYAELDGYITELEASGQKVPELAVALRKRIGFPFTSVVMAIVGMPFAFRLERRGGLYGLGLSVALAVAFFAVYAFFTTLGEIGVFPALVAVWSPSVLFALLAAYLFLGVRT